MILNLKNKFLFNAYIMNINKLSEKLDEIKDKLDNQKIDHNNFIKNIYERNLNDPILENYIKEEYYSTLDPKEREYQKKNDEYKKLVSGFSQAYLDFCEWYVGPELPREHESTFLDDKESINSLYFLFIMSLFFKP